MAHFAKFIDLARSPAELKKDAEKMAPASVANLPVYDYGLCISLTEETLKKLELETEDCEVGATIHLCCMAEVTDFSKRKVGDGVQRRVELQITAIAFENESAENGTAFSNRERIKSRYGIDTGEDD